MGTCVRTLPADTELWTVWQLPFTLTFLDCEEKPEEIPPHATSTHRALAEIPTLVQPLHHHAASTTTGGGSKSSNYKRCQLAIWWHHSNGLHTNTYLYKINTDNMESRFIPLISQKCQEPHLCLYTKQLDLSTPTLHICSPDGHSKIEHITLDQKKV